MPKNPFTSGKLRVSERTIDDILDAASLLLTAASKVVTFAPVPHLSDAVSALNGLIGKVQSMRKNKKTRKDIADRIQTLVVLLERIGKQAESEFKAARLANPDSKLECEVNQHFQQRMEDLNRKLNDSNQAASQLEEKNIICGIVRSDRDAEALNDLKERLNNAIQDFEFEGRIYSEIVVENIDRNLSVLKDVAIDNRDTQTLERIPHASDASFRSALNELKSGFLTGTRTGMLEDLERWARAPLDSGEPAIFVLTGAAGTGKSTIAFEAAKRLDKDGLLGASFFFVRGSEDLATTRLVFSSIAYQLAQYQPDFFPHIVKAAHDYLRGGKEQQMEFTLKDLIIEPLKRGPETHGPVVIVIDAVDECTQAAHDLVPRMLHLLAQYAPSVPFPFRVLITSRPEYHVESALESVDFKTGSKRFKLQDIPQVIVDDDIKKYLNVKMLALPKGAQLLTYRHNVLDTLTKKAEGLFIYASTVINLLRQDAEHGVEILGALLDDEVIDELRPGLSQLDTLYLLVLDNAFDNYVFNPPNNRRKDVMLTLLASIALLQDQLSPITLELLLKVPVHDIQSIVNRLGAVIFVGKDDDPIRPLHASFPQFLVDSQRCTSPKFYVNPIDYQIIFATACLDIMNREDTLHRNICDLSDPATTSKAEVEDLQTRIDNNIPLHVQYACIHWATHLIHVGPSKSVEGFTEFCSNKLLYWFEALSYMSRLDNAPKVLLNIRSWYQNQRSQDGRTRRLIRDGHRFVLEYFDAINECPEHIYISALPTTPSCHLVDVYSTAGTASTAIRMVTSRDPQWGPCERAIAVPTLPARCWTANSGSWGSSCYVSAVTFSPDGRWIVAGVTDGTVQSWDTGSGVILNVMKGHKGEVRLIDVSPDNSRVLSYAMMSERTIEDREIIHWRSEDLRIWNLASGALLHVLPLDQEQEILCALSFSDSFNSLHIISVASVCPDYCNGESSSIPPPNQVRMWDAHTYEPLEVVGKQGPSHLIRSGSFPFSGRSLATWVGNDVHILDYETDHRKLLQGHSDLVRNAVFCAGKTSRVVSRASDETVRVWDAVLGQCLHVLNHGLWIRGLAISSEGNRISLYSDDKIQLWDAETGDAVAVRPALAYAKPVWSLCFSPDDNRLVSGDYSTVRIWDLTESPAGPGSETDISDAIQVWSVDFSENGNFVASVYDTTLSIWSTTTGQLSFQTKETKHIYRVVFSPDEKRIAVAAGEQDTADGYVQIYDIGTRQPVARRVVTDTSREVRVQLYYSPDSALIATVDEPKGWDVHGPIHLTVWKAFDLTLIQKFVPDALRNLYHIKCEFSPDNRKIYIGDEPEGSSYLWDCTTGRRLPDSEMDWELKQAVPEVEDRHGWISDRSGRKLCWLTQSRRPEVGYRTVAFSHGFLAILPSTGQFTLLDISSCWKL